MTERTDFIAKSHEKRRGRRPADRQQPIGVPTVVLLVIVGLILGVRYWRTVLDFFL